MKWTSARHLVLAAAMLAGAGLALAVKPGNHMADHRPPLNLESGIPREFADWRVDTSLAPVTVSPSRCIARMVTRRTAGSSSATSASPTPCHANGRGPLSGLTFGVKDIYDIAGCKTGFGSPEWLGTHEAARATAPVVRKLLEAGADMAGKTQTDELTFSLNGVIHAVATGGERSPSCAFWPTARGGPDQRVCAFGK